MATKLVFNAATGQMESVELTAEEVAQAAADGVAADAAKVVKAAEVARMATYSGDVEVADLLTRLKTVNASQIDTYVDTNVTFTNIAQAQAVMRAVVKRIVKIEALLARQL
jgi:hypothetical protein